MGVVLCTLGIVVGLLLGLGMTKLVVLVATACLGWGMEIANTSIETLCNIVKKEHCEEVKVVKDSFSAVPIFCYSAYAICWLILILPPLVKWIVR
jgi:diacylglycerol kinase